MISRGGAEHRSCFELNKNFFCGSMLPEEVGFI